LGDELRPRGIAVNCVAPGPVLKPERLPDARWTAIRRGGGGGGDGVAAVAAAVVGFSTCAADVTGQVLTVDGEAAVRR
ncbi:MAG: beta-ketoacyl-ACP reductase, partial [Candidatus Rokuibacteriota bacterium]